MVCSARKAFTLVEILIVVVILGILAAIVIPRYSDASEQSAQVAFAMTLDEFVKIADIHNQIAGAYPAEAAAGVMPAAYGENIRSGEWAAETPIGGHWDIMSGGTVTFAVGVVFDTAPTDEFMAKIDNILDDGNLAAGSFQKLSATEFYSILEP